MYICSTEEDKQPIEKYHLDKIDYSSIVKFIENKTTNNFTLNEYVAIVFAYFIQRKRKNTGIYIFDNTNVHIKALL